MKTLTLIEAARSLLIDIEMMQTGEDVFGPFSEHDSNGTVEWPNLAISAERLRTALATTGETVDVTAYVMRDRDQPFNCPDCGTRTVREDDTHERCPKDGTVWNVCDDEEDEQEEEEA